MTQPYLSAQRIHKAFGRFSAVSDVSLDAQRGEFVCVLGPSGCGKTTLLRIIAGFEMQDAGRIVQDGRDISRLPPERRDFGIVFQSYALFPNLTAAQNVAYGLENARKPRQEVRARVEELLALVGLSGSGGQYPAQLSGGQQQRIALARGLALSPGLLLLDEPLSALDAQVRMSLRQEIAQLQRRLNVTTLMVTHDQQEALSMADRIVVMNEGRVAQIGTPADIYHEPADRFVARFVGLMNFVPGQVAHSGGAVRCGRHVLNVRRPLNGLARQGAVTLAVRPEDARVDGVSPGMPNTLPAILHGVEFLGSFCRLRLRLEEGGRDGAAAEPLAVDMPGDTARRLNGSLAPGTRMPVHFPEDRILVFGAA